MGLLNIEYDNNSLGINLLKEKTKYTVFTTDNKLGCINDKYLYCYNTLSEKEFFYDYKNRTVNISKDYPIALDSIRSYAAATVELTKLLLKLEITIRT